MTAEPHIESAMAREAAEIPAAAGRLTDALGLKIARSDIK
jgi:hypothetical protein